jgi:hypothetical protein
MEDFFEELENKSRPNIFRRIQLWWNHDGRYYHKYLKQGIKNIIYWFPIIWKDRNWDSHYIFEILKHKLSAQANYIGKRDFHTRAQQDARRMRLCVKLMQKVQDDEYAGEYLNYTKNKHWFEDIKDRPGFLEWKSQNVWEKYDEYFAKYPLVYKRVMKGEGVFGLDGKNESDLKQRIAMNIAHINQQRAQDLLFKTMNENIQRWWN